MEREVCGAAKLLTEEKITVPAEKMKESNNEEATEAASRSRKRACPTKEEAFPSSVQDHVLDRSYRFDGKTVVSTHGALHVEVENWQYACPRSPVEGGDCDNSATKAKAMLQKIADAPGDVINEYSYLKSIKNVIVPYFTVALGIVGATSSEASNLPEQNMAQAPVAGHAVTFMIPTLQLLHAREKGMLNAKRGGDVPAVMDASLKALFPSEITDTLPPDEKCKFASWEDTSHSTAMMAFANDLHPLASEGTSWTSPAMYMKPGKDRVDVEKWWWPTTLPSNFLGQTSGWD